MPVLKCPYLAQLTLQQVRASAPHILNAGAESCPIFGQVARRMSTTGMTTATPINVSSPPPTFDEIKAAHLKFAERKATPKIKLSSMWNSYGESKDRVRCRYTSVLMVCLSLVTISSECGDLSCPFLKATPIALRRVNVDQDIIEVGRRQGERSLN